MEETFISFVSSCFLDGDHEGHHRTSEEEEENVEEAGELLCDCKCVLLQNRCGEWHIF